MNEEEIVAFGAAKRFRGGPLRGSKRIQRDVRHRAGGGVAGGDRGLPLYPPFQQPPNPSYR